MAKHESADKLQRLDPSGAENDYLRILGERMRDLRARRGVACKAALDRPGDRQPLARGGVRG